MPFHCGSLSARIGSSQRQRLIDERPGKKKHACDVVHNGTGILRHGAGQFDPYLVPSQNVHMDTVSWMVNVLCFWISDPRSFGFEL